MLAQPEPALFVGFDAQTGSWISMRYGVELCSGVAEDVSLAWEGGKLPPLSEWKLVRLREGPGGAEVVRRSGDWEVQTVTRVVGKDIRRSASFRWLGNRPVTVTSTALRSPVLRLSAQGGDQVLLPGEFPVRWIAGALREGAALRESGWTRGEYGLAVLYGKGRGLTVAASYRFVHDQARVGVIRNGAGVVIEHQFDTVAQMRPGDRVTVGEQVFRVIGGDESAARLAIAQLSGQLGNGPPADSPRDVGRTVLYEVHPWGRLESWWAGDRGHRYDRLIALLPYYRWLGVNTLWLLPVSWPPPWVYTLPAFDRIAPENGTPEQLRQLIDRAHRLDMKVLIDLVVYGIHPDSDEVKQLPSDVWCADRQGRPTRVWGGTVLAADTRHPVWQRRIAEVASHWAKDYGFDGTRLDCAGWGQALNWSSDRPNGAIAYGGIQLNKVVRDAFRRYRPGALTLPEGGKPLVFRNADLVFDYPLYMAMRELTWTPDVGTWFADIRQWLEWERVAYPDRARKGLVRFLELHDTVAATEYFGVGPSQALVAALVFMEGVPLLQQEQEIGFSEDLARWLKLRASERCFTHGSASYTAVQCSDPRILAFLREAPDGAAVVLVNVTGDAIRCRVRWPAALSPRFPAAWDGLTTTRLALSANAIETVVPAYRPRVLLLKRAQAQAPQRLPAPTGRRWIVRTAEGTLQDVERDYATKVRPGEALEDALPTLRRARRARELGLMDGSVPDEVRDSGVRVQVNAWFVTLENRAMRITLARRHGGVPARVEATGVQPGPVLGPHGDVYTDQGFFGGGLYASVDGETNPRLMIGRDGRAVVVTFSGTLRQRAWNGVQTCYPADPKLEYQLQYSMAQEGPLAMKLVLTSPGERPSAPYAFYAMRLPIVGFRGWRRGDSEGEAGRRTGGERLGVIGSPDEPLVIHTEHADAVVQQGPGLARLFLIDEGDGKGHLFLAMADGPMDSLRPGQRLEAQVKLQVRPR